MKVLLISLLIIFIICVLILNDNGSIYKSVVTNEERIKKELFDSSNSFIDGISSIPIPVSLTSQSPTYINSKSVQRAKNKNPSSGMKDNSLVLYLDASNPLSYSVGSSTFKDLSGNGNNFSLPSDGAGISWNFPGYFHVNTLSAAVGPSSDKFNISTENTVIVLAKSTGQGCGSLLWFASPDNVRMINIHLPWCDGTIYYDIRSCCDGTNRINYHPANPWNELKHYVFRTRTSAYPNRQIFENGKSMVDSGTNPTSTQSSWGGSSFLWGMGYQTGEWVGDFYFIMVYNRALTDMEIQTNFNYYNNLYNLTTTSNELSDNLLLYSINDTDIDNITKLGKTSRNPARNAQEILSTNGDSPDGVYWILCDNRPTQVYCLMDSQYNGGGWMLMMKMAQGGSTFAFDSPHWTQKTTLNVNDLTLDCNDAKFDVFNSVEIKDVMAIFPKNAGIGISGGCIGTVDWGYTWLVNNWWQNGGKVTGLVGFNTPRDASPSLPDDFCGFSTDIFSEQPLSRRHVFGGHSYLPNSGGTINWGTARWGFAWNENNVNDFSSDDVWGGIGLGGQGRGEMSAGDYYGCCGTARFNSSFGALLFGR